MNKKVVLIGIIALLIAAFFAFDLQQYFSLDFIKEKQQAFNAYYQENTVLTLVIFFVVYVLMAALSLPGAAIMTVLAGALFGLIPGVILVSLASTLGATLAFLVARYLFRDTLQARYADKLQVINDGVEKEGPLYLFAMRLVPLFPFFLVNILMGFTKIKTTTFAWVSQIGMLAGTAVFVYAGTQLAQIDSLSSILSPGLLIAFGLLGVFPVIAKKVMSKIRANKVLAAYDKPKQFDFNLLVIGAGSVVAQLGVSWLKPSIVWVRK